MVGFSRKFLGGDVKNNFYIVYGRLTQDPNLYDGNGNRISYSYIKPGTSERFSVSSIVPFAETNSAKYIAENFGKYINATPKLISDIDIREKLDKLSALVSTERKVKVLWVVQREPLRVAGQNTFINEMIELAGGENTISSRLHKYPPIGAEQVIACGADVIIEPSMQQDGLRAQQNQALQYWSKFDNIPAVANKRIYTIDGDVVSRLSPRLYEGIEIIAECLRPELFKN